MIEFIHKFRLGEEDAIVFRVRINGAKHTRFKGVRLKIYPQYVCVDSISGGALVKRLHWRKWLEMMKSCVYSATLFDCYERKFR